MSKILFQSKRITVYAPEMNEGDEWELHYEYLPNGIYGAMVSTSICFGVYKGVRDEDMELALLSMTGSREMRASVAKGVNANTLLQALHLFESELFTIFRKLYVPPDVILEIKKDIVASFGFDSENEARSIFDGKVHD